MASVISEFCVVGKARLPADFEKYSETPVYTEATIPAALQKEHSTKEGTWALLTVHSGAIDYVVPLRGSTTTVRTGEAIVIEPQVVHHVSLTGEVCCQVQFYR